MLVFNAGSQFVGTLRSGAEVRQVRTRGMESFVPVVRAERISGGDTCELVVVGGRTRPPAVGWSEVFGEIVSAVEHLDDRRGSERPQRAQVPDRFRPLVDRRRLRRDERSRVRAYHVQRRMLDVAL